MNDQQRTRFGEALQRLGGDEETMEMMATIVTEDAPKVLERWSDELQAKDLDAYARTGHALKGLLSTFETNEPVSRIQPLIDDARKNDVAAVRTSHASVVPEIDELLSEISAIL
ncbi:hypothetical protein [Planctomycetes bacterium K23_9]|uniref:HPt domain-containing protein n=1 Tax=Stieleria marina TaxID=1930275 RepID=A0A517NXV1_9BACT|nr:hypothetical protein K239x_39540 [Planctomycetes bacterium K23_9]